MSPIVATLVIAGAVAVYLVLFARTKNIRSDADDVTKQLDRSIQSPDGKSPNLIDAGLARVARPVVRTQAVSTWSQNPMMRNLSAKVSSSGMFGRSLDVFLAYQVAAGLISATMVTLAFVGAGMDTFARIVLVVGAFAISAWPYDKVNRELKKKSSEAAEALPDFVELLLIPISSGMSVESSLAFTAKQADNIVSQNVKWLLETLSSRTMSEKDAYTEAGKRIGTPEAVAFFSSLYQAQVQGVQISESLRRQADSLRVKSHEERRGQIKKIPVKMIIVFGLHFLPLLFILALLPLIISFSQL